jgi:hypothetical protein
VDEHHLIGGLDWGSRRRCSSYQREVRKQVPAAWCGREACLHHHPRREHHSALTANCGDIAYRQPGIRRQIRQSAVCCLVGRKLLCRQTSFLVRTSLPAEDTCALAENAHNPKPSIAVLRNPLIIPVILLISPFAAAAAIKVSASRDTVLRPDSRSERQDRGAVKSGVRAIQMKSAPGY